MNIKVVAFSVILLSATITIGAYSWPYGYDAFHWFLREYTPSVTISAWGFLVTSLIGQLAWPLNLRVWTFLSVLTISICAYLVGNRRWYLVPFTAVAIWNMWLGQVEAIHVIGVTLGYLIITKRLRVEWLGLAVAFMADKPQVGLLAIPLMSFLAYQVYGPGILRALLVFVSYTLVTLIVFPNWIINWLDVMRHFDQSVYWNSSIFPYGLVALLLVVKRSDSKNWTRRALAATLLASPYFALYHATSLLIFEESPEVLIGTWAVVLFGVATGSIGTFGWLIPAFILVREFYLVTPFHANLHAKLEIQTS